MRRMSPGLGSGPPVGRGAACGADDGAAGAPPPLDAAARRRLWGAALRLREAIAPALAGTSKPSHEDGSSGSHAAARPPRPAPPRPRPPRSRSYGLYRCCWNGAAPAAWLPWRSPLRGALQRDGQRAAEPCSDGRRRHVRAALRRWRRCCELLLWRRRHVAGRHARVLPRLLSNRRGRLRRRLWQRRVRPRCLAGCGVTVKGRAGRVALHGPAGRKRPHQQFNGVLIDMVLDQNRLSEPPIPTTTPTGRPPPSSTPSSTRRTSSTRRSSTTPPKRG